MAFWYALSTKPNQERCVAGNLRQREVEVYLPLVMVNPVNPRAAHERPYFPGYLFARLDLPAVGLSAVQWTPGMRRLVQFGGSPGIVPDGLIGELRRRLAKISAVGGLAFDDLHAGDVVRIISGPLAGYEAVFDMRLSGSDRVRVLLEMMRQTHPAGRQDQTAGRQAESPAGSASRRGHPAAAGLTRQVPVELAAGCIEKVKKNN